MNEKEFRKLKRSELIELIYELEVDLEKVQQENEQLRQKLDQKTSEIKNLTSLEQAVERLNRIYEVAVPSSGEEVVKEEDRLDEMLNQRASRVEKAIHRMEEEHKAEWQKIKDEQLKK